MRRRFACGCCSDLTSGLAQRTLIWPSPTEQEPSCSCRRAVAVQWVSRSMSAGKIHGSRLYSRASSRTQLA